MRNEDIDWTEANQYAVAWAARAEAIFGRAKAWDWQRHVDADGDPKLSVTMLLPEAPDDMGIWLEQERTIGSIKEDLGTNAVLFVGSVSVWGGQQS